MGAMASDLGIRSSKFTSGIFRAKLILPVSKECETSRKGRKRQRNKGTTEERKAAKEGRMKGGKKGGKKGGRESGRREERKERRKEGRKEEMQEVMTMPK